MATNVMVTGTGAVIGYGILRSLREMGPTIRLVATDVFPDAVGQHWADAFEQAPFTCSDEYPEWLKECLQRNEVDLLIPGIEQDVHRYANEPEMFAHSQTHVVLNDPALIRLCRDKWLLHEVLKAAAGVVVIPSFLEGSFDQIESACGLPFLLKPRVGYASKGLLRIRNREEFVAQSHRIGVELMAQPIVGSDDEEYTVAVFGDGKGGILASIALQRRLSPEGATSKASVVSLPDLDCVCSDLCALFKPLGPTNFQFRRVSDGWRLLEINPRISSSTSIRAAFGYNEAQMCLRHFLEGKTVEQPEIRLGRAIRYIADYVTFDP